MPLFTDFRYAGPEVTVELFPSGVKQFLTAKQLLGCRFMLCLRLLRHSKIYVLMCTSKLYGSACIQPNSETD